MVFLDGYDLFKVVKTVGWQNREHPKTVFPWWYTEERASWSLWLVQFRQHPRFTTGNSIIFQGWVCYTTWIPVFHSLHMITDGQLMWIMTEWSCPAISIATMGLIMKTTTELPRSTVGGNGWKRDTWGFIWNHCLIVQKFWQTYKKDIIGNN